MQLSVYVLGREVATLEQSGDFKSVLTYHPQVAADDWKATCGTTSFRPCCR